MSDGYEQVERAAIQADTLPRLRPEFTEPSGCGCRMVPRLRCAEMQELLASTRRTWSHYIREPSTMMLRTHERAVARMTEHRAKALGCRPPKDYPRHEELGVRRVTRGHVPTGVA
jgi:hypothetical protein